MNIFEPYHETQLLPVIEMALNSSNPSYIRMKKFDKMYTDIDKNIQIGEPQILKEGSTVAIFACGMTVDIALEAASEINKKHNHK